MQLQLIKYYEFNWSLLSLIFLLLAYSFSSNAQDKEKVTIDILSSYYQQDGNHSAVTGGIGTEKLKDFSNKIIINVPLKKNKALYLNQGLSYLSSASSDNVDPNTFSAASSTEVRASIDAAISKKDTVRNSIISYKVGLSHEMHFMSLNGGVNYDKTVSPKTSFDGSVHFLFDIWSQYYDISHLYPIEIRRRPGLLDNNKRYTLSLGFGWNQILSKKLQFRLGAELINQFGLLSTPYNRIFFNDISGFPFNVTIERLPDYRIRIPITLKLNYYAADWLILRNSIRNYWDNFGVYAVTYKVEPVFKINRFMSVYPFYRITHQSGSKYFAPYNAHISAEEYYVSDYDMSTFNSHFWGGGVRFAPALGLVNLDAKKDNNRKGLWRSIAFRGGYYIRNDGFKSWMVSMGLGFEL